MYTYTEPSAKAAETGQGIHMSVPNSDDSGSIDVYMLGTEADQLVDAIVEARKEQKRIIERATEGTKSIEDQLDILEEQAIALLAIEKSLSTALISAAQRQKLEEVNAEQLDDVQRQIDHLAEKKYEQDETD